MGWISAHATELTAAGVVVLALMLGFLSRRLVVAPLRRLAEKTSWRADDVLVASVCRPLPVLFVLGGLWLASRIARPPEHLVSLADKLIVSAIILTLTFWAAGLAVRLLRTGLHNMQGVPPAPMSGVMLTLARICVLVVGGLVILSNLGISITPVLTTLGIGGLAVALALQDTLANLFAGLHITLAGNIRVGDFVKLSTGEEGFVGDIGWRATRIRTLPNNYVLIPNSSLAQSVVTNYSMPSRDLAVLVQVGVHYTSDLDRVERITKDVARSIMRSVPGGVPEFDPFIRYHTFGESSIDFTVILRAREYTDNFLVKHEFIKALARRFAQERIVIPFPIRAINLDQESAQAILDGDRVHSSAVSP